MADAVMQGHEASFHWLQNASRVMKVSKYFQDSDVRWKLGALLIAGAEVERLHWVVMGCTRRKLPKANLSDLFDPFRGAVPNTLVQLRLLMDRWHLGEGSPWRLLLYLGRQAVDDEETSRFCRALLLQVAAGFFRRLDLRHAAWPYKLVWLLSEKASEEERRSVAKQLVTANDCCLDVFSLKFRTLFPDEEAILGSKARSVLLMFERELKFTTAPVECEHASTRDDAQSRTGAGNLASATHRSVCRHLHRAHMQRGGLAACLPLRRSTVESHTVLGQDDVGLQPIANIALQAAPVPIADGEVAQALEPPPADLALEPRAEDPGIDFLSSIGGGGNPKMLYMNYKMHDLKARGRKMSRDEAHVERRRLSAEYDSKPEVQRRWKILFAEKMRQTKHAKRQLQAVVDQRPTTSVAVWASSLQVLEQSSDMPIAPSLLADLHKSLTKVCLDKMIQDAADYTVSEGNELKHLPTLKGLFGCASEWHNTCDRKVAATGKARLFKHLQVALNKWVDSLLRIDITGCNALVRLSSDPAHGPVLTTWMLLCWALFNPKVQTFARCAPVDLAPELNEQGFATTVPDGPSYELEISVAPCRVCADLRHLGDRQNMLGIHFETSGELILRLLERPVWTLTRLEHTMSTTSHSLRRMVVQGISGDAVPLRAEAGRRVAVPDAFAEFCRLPQGSAIQSGIADSTVFPGALGDDVDEAGVDASDGMECDPEASEMVDHMLEDMLEDMLSSIEAPSAQMVGEIVAEFCGVDGGSDGEDDDQHDDSHECGATEPEDRVPEDVSDGLQEGPPIEVIQEVADALDLASSALGFGASSSSSGGPDPPLAPVAAPAPAIVGADEQEPRFTISELGYVRTSRAPFQPNQQLGLVGYKSDMSAIFANCHVHPHCSVSCGIRRHDVAREVMAEWLLLAVPISETAPMAERREETKRHRAAWIKPVFQ
jgi:hypothetical protein